MTLLYVLFFIKHFLADFPLQTKFMLKKTGPHWFFPLLLHSSVHGVLTLLILLPFTSLAPLFALGEIFIHFGIDYWKAQKCKYPIDDTRFWTSLGLDQLFHYLTYAGIIFLVNVDMVGF